MWMIIVTPSDGVKTFIVLFLIFLYHYHVVHITAIVIYVFASLKKRLTHLHIVAYSIIDLLQMRRLF